MLAAIAAVAGVPAVLANVPRSSEIANDTAIYQNLHEIKVTHAKSLSFDGDIARLSAQEKSHREALPLRISAPMERVMTTPYRSSGTTHKAPVKPARLQRPSSNQ
jgi:hypothetical protein